MEFSRKVLEAMGVVTRKQFQKEAMGEPSEVPSSCNQVLGGVLGSPGQEASSSQTNVYHPPCDAVSDSQRLLGSVTSPSILPCHNFCIFLL